MIALSGWWIVGWAAGLVVVAIAAALLLAIIALGRRISRQAGQITEALDETRANTAPLFELTRANLAIDQIATRLRRLREGAPR